MAQRKKSQTKVELYFLWELHVTPECPCIWGAKSKHLHSLFCFTSSCYSEQVLGQVAGCLVTVELEVPAETPPATYQRYQTERITRLQQIPVNAAP